MLVYTYFLLGYSGVVRYPSNDTTRKGFAYISVYEYLYIRNIHAELRVTEGVKGEERVGRECGCSSTIF